MTHSAANLPPSTPHSHPQIYRRTFSSRLSAATELSYNRIGWGDAEALLVASVLQSGATPRLRELDLSFNTIGDSGAKAIAAALPHAPQVERLDLSDNRIGDAGAAALANALLRSPSVAWLNLHTNLIGDQGALALANVLPRATQLLWLNLHSNTDINGPALERLWHQANVIRKATTRPFRLLAPGRDKASFRFEPAPEDEPAAAASGDSSDKGGSRA
jgi:Ran GTPase-activating protein (RanGAP) involved in mRNA processing and transport